jgi:aspartyl/asparaginyl beta-hydroxylase (cupin superfamily)
MKTTWAIELQEIASHIQDIESENRKLRKAIEKHKKDIGEDDINEFDKKLWEFLE